MLNGTADSRGTVIDFECRTIADSLEVAAKLLATYRGGTFGCSAVLNIHRRPDLNSAYVIKVGRVT